MIDKSKNRKIYSRNWALFYGKHYHKLFCDCIKKKSHYYYKSGIFCMKFLPIKIKYNLLIYLLNAKKKFIVTILYVHVEQIFGHDGDDIFCVAKKIQPNYHASCLSSFDRSITIVHLYIKISPYCGPGTILPLINSFVHSGEWWGFISLFQP